MTDEDYDVDEKGTMLHRMQGRTQSDLLERVAKNSVLFRIPYATGDQIPVKGKMQGRTEVEVNGDETKELHYTMLVSDEPIDTEEAEKKLGL